MALTCGPNGAVRQVRPWVLLPARNKLSSLCNTAACLLTIPPFPCCHIAGLSLVVVIYKVAFPRISQLGKLPDSRIYRRYEPDSLLDVASAAVPRLLTGGLQSVAPSTSQATHG
jgi:hypothetical protein